jgi:hypothetical protein
MENKKSVVLLSSSLRSLSFCVCVCVCLASKEEGRFSFWVGHTNVVSPTHKREYIKRIIVSTSSFVKNPRVKVVEKARRTRETKASLLFSSRGPSSSSSFCDEEEEEEARGRFPTFDLEARRRKGIRRVECGRC